MFFKKYIVFPCHQMPLLIFNNHLFFPLLRGVHNCVKNSDDSRLEGGLKNFFFSSPPFSSFEDINQAVAKRDTSRSGKILRFPVLSVFEKRPGIKNWFVLQEYGWMLLSRVGNVFTGNVMIRDYYFFHRSLLAVYIYIYADIHTHIYTQKHMKCSIFISFLEVRNSFLTDVIFM